MTNSDSLVASIISRIVGLLIVYYFGKLFFRFLLAEFLQCIKTKNRTGAEFRYYEYFLYRLDYLFSRHPKLKGGAIGITSMTIIIVGGVFWFLVTDDDIYESLWIAWTFVADPGTHSETKGILQRIISLALTAGGMVIFASVIGIISDEISSSLENLRKGKSRVIEANHTLILGQVLHI